MLSLGVKVKALNPQLLVQGGLRVLFKSTLAVAVMREGKVLLFDFPIFILQLQGSSSQQIYSLGHHCPITGK